MSTLSTAHKLRNPATKHYNGVDLIKFLCAFLIVALHIDPFQGGGSVWAERINYWTNNYLTRIAVPFYFVTTGFFLFGKMSLTELNMAKIKDYCIKILLLRAIWTILLHFGDSYHLWYLDATVVAVVFMTILLHLRLRFCYIALIAGVCYMFGLFGDAYFGLTRALNSIPGVSIIRIIGDGQNGVFVGFPFVLLGAYFAHHMPKCKAVTAFVGFAVSMACLLAEVFLLEKFSTPLDHNVYIFLLPAAYFLLAFACKLELKDRPIYRELRMIGFLVYALHMMVDWVLEIAFALTAVGVGVNLTKYRFFLTVLITLLIAVLIRRLAHKKKFRWLNYLTS